MTRGEVRQPRSTQVMHYQRAVACDLAARPERSRLERIRRSADNQPMTNWAQAGGNIAVLSVASALAWREYRRDPQGAREHFGERVHPAMFFGAVAVAVALTVWLVLLFI
jgi:hypothetical protein